MPENRFLIVNADDFGRSPGVNRGVIAAHEHGIVTSASLMVRWPAAVEAAAYVRAHSELSLGLHLDLSEWLYRADRWIPVYEVVPLADGQKVADEVSRQLEIFRQLVGSYPTHIDSHQHAHLREPVLSIVTKVADELNIPLRQCNSKVCYCGHFYGQTAEGHPYPEGISVARLIELLTKLPSGCTEIGCHPGFASDLDTTYRAEREQEVRTLCDGRVRKTIREEVITLRSFTDLQELPQGANAGGAQGSSN